MQSAIHFPADPSMFGLPEDFDPSFLIGRTLEGVSVSQFQVILRFDQQVMVSVESDVVILEQGGQLDLSDSAEFGKVAVDLLSSVVAAADGSADGTLTLDFDGDRGVKILDSNQHHESYQIGQGERLVVLGHQVGVSRLMGGCRPRAWCLRVWL